MPSGGCGVKQRIRYEKAHGIELGSAPWALFIAPSSLMKLLSIRLTARRFLHSGFWIHLGPLNGNQLAEFRQ